LQFPAWAGRIPSDALRSYADIGDLITYFYPTRSFAAKSVKQGILPLWNPLLLSGEPFLANAQSSLFYPQNVAYYVLSLPTAWAVCIMLRTFLAALFMAMFLRSIGGSKTGSIFAGIVFASCGFMTAWQGQPMTDSAIWLPFVCFAIQKLHKKVSGIWTATAATGFAMPLLAGHPETTAHVMLTGTALALTLWAFPPDIKKPRFDRHFIVAFVFVGVLALGLASVQMVPTLEWLRQLGGTLNDAWPPLALREGLGWVSRDILRSPNSAGIDIPEACAYMAMVSIVAAPLALFHRPRVYAALLSLIAVSAIAIAYGLEPVKTLVSHIPVLRALKNYRMLVASFAVAGLAGLGISALEQDIPWTRKSRLAALALVASMFSFTFFLNHELQLATKFKAEVMHRPSFSRTLLIISLILIAGKLYEGLRKRTFSFVLCSIAMFDLGTFAFGYTGLASRGDIFPPSPVFDFLARDKSAYRIIAVGLPYSANAPLMYGLESADGYEIDVPVRQRAFLDDLIRPAVEANGINFVADHILQDRDRRLDLLNVKYLVAPAFGPDFTQLSQSGRFTEVFNNKEVAVFQNASVLPRVWLVPASGIETVRDLHDEVSRLKNPAFDPLKFVTISQTLPLPDPGSAATAADINSSAAITSTGPNSLTVQTQAPAPSVLVVSQTYYPGWSAMVDGKQSDILQADITLTGVSVPAGAHKVSLVFQPRSFRIGLGVTVLTTMILLAMIIGELAHLQKHAKDSLLP
jgi:hypothetical protein